ncbi:MAG TPA: metallophosphoesterase [Methanoregula sp.]|nr:metallophosphoesterase [Methanoregula sp.]
MIKKLQYSAGNMGVVIFSDVHADSVAIGSLASCIRSPQFRQEFGPVDVLVNLGDLIHRGDRPRETLEMIHTLSHEYRLVSVLGNHDHAFMNGILVSGSDPASTYRHEQIRGSPLLSLFDHMPMEWSDRGMLFVHGGPLDLGKQTLRLKCWQRLSHESGDSFAGYNYTASMAFEALEARGFIHMCCGHQHQNICCRKTPGGIVQKPIEYLPSDTKRGEPVIGRSLVPLDLPSLLRVGGCHGDEPEFAYTDFSTFSFIRINAGDW